MDGLSGFSAENEEALEFLESNPETMSESCEMFLLDLLNNDIDLKKIDIDMLIKLSTIDADYLSRVKNVETTRDFTRNGSKEHYITQIQDLLKKDGLFFEALHFDVSEIDLQDVNFHFSFLSPSQRKDIYNFITDQSPENKENISKFRLVVRKLLSLGVPLNGVDFDSLYILIDEKLSDFGEVMESIENLKTEKEKLDFVYRLSGLVIPSDFENAVLEYSPKKPTGRSVSSNLDEVKNGDLFGRAEGDG